MSDETNAPDLSIVATAYNTADVVAPLIKQIRAVVESLKINYEIILVDDGSSDERGSSVNFAVKYNVRRKITEQPTSV